MHGYQKSESNIQGGWQSWNPDRGGCDPECRSASARTTLERESKIEIERVRVTGTFLASPETIKTIKDTYASIKHENSSLHLYFFIGSFHGDAKKKWSKKNKIIHEHVNLKMFNYFLLHSELIKLPFFFLSSFKLVRVGSLILYLYVSTVTKSIDDEYH